MRLRFQIALYAESAEQSVADFNPRISEDYLESHTLSIHRGNDVGASRRACTGGHKHNRSPKAPGNHTTQSMSKGFSDFNKRRKLADYTFQNFNEPVRAVNEYFDNADIALRPRVS
jgi:hypothetical protein